MAPCRELFHGSSPLRRISGSETARAGDAKTARCLEIAPDNPDCHLSYAASRGASAIAHGIFSTLADIRDRKTHASCSVTKAKPFPMAPFRFPHLTLRRAHLQSSTVWSRIGGSLRSWPALEVIRRRHGVTRKMPVKNGQHQHRCACSAL